MRERLSSIKRFQELSETDQIVRGCMDLLITKQKQGVIPQLTEIISQNNKLKQIILKTKICFNLQHLSSYESLEGFLADRIKIAQRKT